MTDNRILLLTPVLIFPCLIYPPLGMVLHPELSMPALAYGPIYTRQSAQL